jgi:hypothetical protein
MIGNYLFIALLGSSAAPAYGGASACCRRKLAFFASIPVKQDDGTWEAVNITWYGLLLSSANVFAAMIFFVMLVRRKIAAGLCCSFPSCSSRSGVEPGGTHRRKSRHLTIGGAASVGAIAALSYYPDKSACRAWASSCR